MPAVCVAVFAGLTVHSYTQKSATFDEPLHLLAGYAAVQAGDFRVDPTHPPLGRMWAALPLLVVEEPELGLEQVDAMRGRDWLQRNTQASRQFMFADNDGERLLYLARGMVVALGIALGLLLYRWSRQWSGDAAGIAVVAAYVLTPSFLAHSALVTTDVPITVAMTAAVYAAWRFVQRPSLGWLIALGLATGAAAATKFSGVLLAPMLCVLLGVAAWSPASPVRWRHVAGALLAVAAMSWLVVWAAYGFRFAPSATSTWLFHADRVPAVQQHFGGWLSLATWVDQHRLLPNAFTHGALLADASVVQIPAYLAGSYSESGWWYYFPIAFLVKAPVVFVLLALSGLGLTILSVVRRPLSHLDAWFVVVPVLVIGAAAVMSGINIGVRHILPIYPFLLLALGRMVATIVASPRPWLRWTLAAGAIFWAVQVGRAHPHHLAYFSAAIGGAHNGGAYLADSNLDWGQDLKALKGWMDAQHVTHINLAYFGTADPAYYGIEWTPLPGSGLGIAGQRPQLPGYVAISATMQSGVYLPRRWRLFLGGFGGMTPLATIGRTIRVYWVDRWPEAPPPSEWTPARLAAARGLADSLSEWGWFDHAATHYRRYLAQRPDDLPALAGLASALVNSGQGPEALAVVAAARARLPAHPGIHDLYGRLLVTEDRPDEAEQSFQRAIALDPAWPAPREALQRLQGETPGGGRLLSQAPGSVGRQRVNQGAPGIRRLDGGALDDFAHGQFLAVDLLVGAVVRPKRRALERDAGEETTRAGVAQDLGAHGDIRRGFRMTSLGPGGYGRLHPEFGRAIKDGGGAAWIHDDQHEVGRFRAQLKSE